MELASLENASTRICLDKKYCVDMQQCCPKLVLAHLTWLQVLWYSRFIRRSKWIRFPVWTHRCTNTKSKSDL